MSRLSYRARLVWTAAGCAVMAGAGALLHAHDSVFDESDYFADVAVLRRIKELDARIELEMLKARVGLNANYDALAGSLAQLQQLAGELDEDAPTETYAQAGEMAFARNALKEAVGTKAALLERFKSGNSVLQNSLAFLPTAADDAHHALPAAAERIHHLMVDSLLQAQGRGRDAEAAVEAGLALLESRLRGLPPGPGRERLDLFLLHVRAVRREHKVVDGLVSAIVKIPVASRTDALNNLMNNEEQVAHMRTQRLRVYLVALSLLLMGLLAFAGVQLVRRNRTIASINRALQSANAGLELRVAQRTAELHKTRDELLATARQAGRAEVATNVLHNVGNILNTVNVSAGVVASTVRNSRGQGLGRAARMLQERAGDLPQFLAADEKGRLLPGYLAELAQALEQERAQLAGELDHMIRSVDHIKAVVATQQSHARRSSLMAPAQLRDLLEDALRINADAQPDDHLETVRDYEAVPPALLDRDRVLQILVNLISNARLAMKDTPGRPRLTLRLRAAGSTLRLQVQDQGEGIVPDNLTRIFAHGFTTRASGHGFGLHSCHLAARQMGGTLTAHSDGAGRGATFTLELPLERQAVAA